MTDDRQMPLFAGSMLSPSPCEATSQQLSEPSTPPNDGQAKTPSDANRSGSTALVTARSTYVGVGYAASRSPAAKHTAGFEPQPTLPTFTERRTTEASTLTIPRPTTRAECLAEARPCPWVGCRHHLLLEVTRSKRRPSSLRLNAANRGQTKIGRRPALRSSAAAAIVRGWIDDAVELLSRMRFTCSLDVVDHYQGEELPDHALALLLGVRRQYINGEVRVAVLKQREAMAHLAIIDIDDDGRVLGTIGEQHPDFGGR